MGSARGSRQSTTMKISGWCLTGEEVHHPIDTTINKVFEDMLEENTSMKEKIALIDAETKNSVTYGELNENANIIARMLLGKIKTNNLKPNADGDYIVALRFLPGSDLVTTILATFKAGLAYVPIAPNWPEGRIKHIVDDAAPIMIITNTASDILYKAQKNLPVVKKRGIFKYEDILEEAKNTHTSNKMLANNQILNNSIKGGRLYSVLYTSGSTGTPKGVRHVHRAALNRLYWQWRTFPYKDDEVCVFKTTLTFVDSVTEIWSPLLCGKQLIIFPTKVTQNVEKFVEVLEEYKIGRIFVVTSLVRSILAFLKLSKGGKQRLSHVKYWDCSAETVTKEVLLSFFDYFKTGHTISNLYGSTEMMDVTFESFSSISDVMNVVKDNKIPIGSPVDNTKAYVLDENMGQVEEGTMGSLYISGRNLGDGYVGAKKGSFMDNHITKMEDEVDMQENEAPNNFSTLYKTGDYATIFNGRLYYEGRLDAQIKVRGHRVDLSEVEKAVTDVPGIKKCAVLCYKPGEPQQKVLCYYTVEDEIILPESKLELLLRSTLPDYMMPKVIKLSMFPLLVNGKTDRQKLLQKYEDTLACSNFSFAEEDVMGLVPKERYNQAIVVLESVSSVIYDAGRKPTLNDCFFNIGGDSINMVMVISRINDHGYHITVTDFVTSCKLANVVMAVTTEPMADDLSRAWKMLQDKNNYASSELEAAHKDIVLDMISRSFADKGDLTTIAEVTYDNLMEQLEILWESLITANLSIVIKNRKGEVIGACLNFDARSEEAAPLCACSAFSRNMAEDENRQETQDRHGRNDGTEEEVPLSVVEFLNAIEEPLKDKHIPKERGKFIYTSLLGTAKDLSTAENVEVAIFMEQENIRLGREKGFKGIFTTNANRLTQLIARSLDYEILATVHVNQYEDHKGARPFASAPDDLVTEIAMKRF